MNKASSLAMTTLESLRFTATLIIIDVVPSLLYSYLAGIPFPRALSIVVILEGAVIMMVSSLLMPGQLKREYRGVGQTVGEDLDESPSKTPRRVPRGIPLILSAVFLIVMGFLIDFIGVR
jgi:hypothetical protein